MLNIKDYRSFKDLTRYEDITFYIGTKNPREAVSIVISSTSLFSNIEIQRDFVKLVDKTVNTEFELKALFNDIRVYGAGKKQEQAFRFIYETILKKFDEDFIVELLHETGILYYGFLRYITSSSIRNVKPYFNLVKEYASEDFKKFINGTLELPEIANSPIIFELFLISKEFRNAENDEFNTIVEDDLFDYIKSTYVDKQVKKDLGDSLSNLLLNYIMKNKY